MKPSDRPQILPPHDSTSLRLAYLQAFVDTQNDYYRRYIAKLRKFSDGKHYDGYIWDCLRDPVRITFQELCSAVTQFPMIFAMADDHSRDKVINAALWPYPPYSVVRFKPQIFLHALPALPEDIYIFDTSVSWTLVLTHEHDGPRRICCSEKNESGA